MNVIDNIFKFLTLLGDETFLLVALPIIYFTRKRLGLKVALSVLIGVFISHLLKPLLRFERPPKQYWKVSASGYSFPSGHATNASTFWGYVAYVARRRLHVTIISILIAALVGYSRVYLCVHWWTDVIAGWILGFLIIAAVEGLDGKFGKKIDTMGFKYKLSLGFSIPFLAIGLSAVAIGVDLPEFKSLLKALSSLSGILTGHLIAGRFGISLDDTNNILTVIARSIVCIILVMVVYGLYKSVKLLNLPIIVSVFWLFGIIVTLITPLVFKVLKHR